MKISSSERPGNIKRKEEKGIKLVVWQISLGKELQSWWHHHKEGSAIIIVLITSASTGYK